MSGLRLALLSSVWFALFAQWTTIVPTMVPAQLGIILGPDNPAKEGWTGSILAAGSFMALVVAPIVGAWSDRSRHRTGRRRPFLVAGMAATCVGLLLLLAFGPGSAIALYAAAFLFLQSAWNVVAGAYAGLIPDVVPEHQQPAASAWLNIMTVAGTAFGNVLLILLYRPGQPVATMVAFIALNLVAAGVTLRFVQEPPPAARDDRKLFDWQNFCPSLREHRDFYWVLVSRLMASFGTWPVFTFLLYYFGDVLGVAEPAKVLPGLLAAGAVAAVPASLAVVRLAPRFGLVRVTQFSNAVMAACAVLLVLIALRPSLALALPVLLVFAACFGSYQSADWALALRVLPDRAESGKDMGIWHISMVLPQVVGPAAAGWMISAVRRAFDSQTAYTAMFAIAAIFLILAVLCMRPLRRLDTAEWSISAATPGPRPRPT